MAVGNKLPAGIKSYLLLVIMPIRSKYNRTEAA